MSDDTNPKNSYNLISKLTDFSFALILTSLILYLDIFVSIYSNNNILTLSYSNSEQINFGMIIALIGSFAFLAAVISPLFFAIFNYIYWKTAPSSLLIDPAYDSRKIVYLSKLKEWAIIENNSQAMSIVKSHENGNKSINNIKRNLFLLAIFLLSNYYLSDISIVNIIVNNLINIDFGYSKTIINISLIALFVLSLYISENDRIYLPELAKTINKVNENKIDQSHYPPPTIPNDQTAANIARQSIHYMDKK